MKVEGLTEYKPKSVKLSPVACQAWVNILRAYFDGKWKLKYVVIPVIAYTPNTDSNDGSNCRYKFITVKYETIEEIKVIPVDTQGQDVALNRNIMAIFEGEPPKMVTLDIIDCVPLMHPAELDTIKTNYNILKTRNSYHLYAKHDVDSKNGGDIIQDPQWHMKYIRITESEAKGEITRFDSP